MGKSLKKRFIYFSVITQIFLMISFSFALAFLMSNNSVVAVTLTLPSSIAETQAKLAAARKAELASLGNSNLGTPSPILNPTPYKSLYGGQGFGSTGLPGALLAGFAWAATAYLAVKMVGSMLGLNQGTQKALSNAAAGGAFVAGTLHAFAANQVGQVAGAGGFGAGTGGGILSEGFWGTHYIYGGLIVAAAIFVLTYSSESKKLVNFQCLPYEPPLGGASCEQCNKDSFRPCSQYRCLSLGQACKLLNPGTADEQCVWVNPHDVNSPTITPWDAALSPTGLKYMPDKAIRPPAIGTKIVTSGGGCLPAFTPLQFGITTNEPAQCKVDYNHTNSYDDMQYYFGGSNYFDYNHTQAMALPGPNTGNNNVAPLLQNNGQFSLYVRCRDANNNTNIDEYAFSFCVNQGPDTTPPVIEGFSIPSGSYVGFNQQNVSIQLYTNEPASCNWDIQDKAYDSMVNNMTCFTQSYQVNANLQYTCYGNLTGIKNHQSNTFYFRCKDQPDKSDNERNVNVQSTPLVLMGSQPLVILSALPNATISGGTNTIPVNLQLETSAGAAGNGNATCLFSPTGNNGTYIQMFQTNSYVHSQTLSLAGGSYTYYFECIDAGGNAAETSTSFNINVVTQPPVVTRVYNQNALKIVTSEDAECSYSLTSCNFDIANGIKMIYSEPSIKDNLYATWTPSNTYYIRCKDLYGNEPSPNTCSLVASPISLNS